MKPVPLWKVSVDTTPEAEEAVSELLASKTGQPASSYTDAQTQRTTVSVYLEARAEPGRSKSMDGASGTKFRSPAGFTLLHPENWFDLKRQIEAGLARAEKCGLPFKPGTVRLDRVKREDWAESWKRHFKPLAIGRRLLIKPSWSERKPKKGQCVVVLDPGLSFGTGHHPTTAFCLGQLARHCKPGSSCLDAGTGSGLLAIAAAKLGCSIVEAFDFDPDAVRVARVNLRTNGVAQRVRLFRADLTRLSQAPRKRFDIVCANLISTLLVAEKHRIVARVKSGGLVILAGILRSEFDGVRRAYESAGLRMTATQVRNEWQSAAFRITGSELV